MSSAEEAVGRVISAKYPLLAQGLGGGEHLDIGHKWFEALSVSQIIGDGHWLCCNANDHGLSTWRHLISTLNLEKASLLWTAFFALSPEELYNAYSAPSSEGRWMFPYGEAATQEFSSCLLPEEAESHTVPRVFEVIDYFLPLTRRVGNTVVLPWGKPYYHIAMDLSHPEAQIYQMTFRRIGKRFFEERYPGFFFDWHDWPFQTKAERRLAFWFQKLTLPNGNLEWNRFESETRVLRCPNDELRFEPGSLVKLKGWEPNRPNDPVVQGTAGTVLRRRKECIIPYVVSFGIVNPDIGADKWYAHDCELEPRFPPPPTFTRDDIWEKLG
jgi:hypothetical protein